MAKHKWESRYRELEKSIEQMIVAFENKLKAVESTAPLTTAINSVEIRKLVWANLDGNQVLVCVADGVNMEFSFTLTGDTGESVVETGFQRSNCIMVSERQKRAARQATVRINSYTRSGKESLTKEFGI